MGEVIGMFDRQKMDEEDIAREREEQRKDREAIEHLTAYSRNLGRAEALEVEGERGTPEDITLPEDLTLFSLEGKKSVTAKGVNAVVLQSLLEDAKRRGVDLDSDRTRALNNLVQFEEVGRVIEKPASISLPSSRERTQLNDEIRARKNALLRDIIGPEETGRVSYIKRALEEHTADLEWNEELGTRMAGVKAALRSTEAHLEAMKRAQKTYIAEELQGPVSLEQMRNRVERLKKIEEAEVAFRKGDPTIIRHEDPFMEDLARGERVRRTDLNQRRTAVAYDFYRGKIRDILRATNVSSVEKSS